MPSFTSDRERRLWIWALVTVVAIFSTLGLARTLAEELRNRQLIDAAFGFALLLLMAAVVTLGLHVRPRGVEMGVALGISAVYVMVLLRMALPEERTHLIEYGLVAVLIHEALTERRSHGRRVPMPAAVAVTAAALTGWLDEGIQAVIPSRAYDWRDVGFNTLAALMAIAASLALAGVRQRVRRHGRV